MKYISRLSIPPPPLSIWAFVGLWILTALVYYRFLPPPGTEAWGQFHWYLMLGVALVGIGLWSFFWPPERRCSLYFKELLLYEPGEGKIVYQERCGAPAVGSVMISGSLAQKKYFCAVHNPNLAWVERWLLKNNLQVLSSTYTLFHSASNIMRK